MARALSVLEVSSGVVVSRQSGELLRRRRPFSWVVRCLFIGGAWLSSEGESGVRRTEPRRDDRDRRAIARQWRSVGSVVSHAVGELRKTGGMRFVSSF